jgi:hypothetical protein
LAMPGASVGALMQQFRRDDHERGPGARETCAGGRTSAATLHGVMLHSTCVKSHSPIFED